jgi:hypothetical protein
MGLGWGFMGSTHHTARTVGYSGESCTRRSNGFLYAFDLRTRELDAWTRHGDAVGQSMALNCLANICLLRHQTDPADPSNTTEDAHTYYARAEAALNCLNDDAANKQRDLVRENRARLLLLEATHLLHKTVRVHRLVLATMYNGRIGYVHINVPVTVPGKYVVRLHATADAPECELIVKQGNLELFGPQAEVSREGAVEI